MSGRDPRADPQPGDIFRDPQEVYARKIVKRESDRVLVEIGANNRGWQKLATWHKWAARSGVTIAT